MVEIDQELDAGSVGWTSFGGAARGADADGCNPAVEDCNPPVAVRSTTWGRLKQQYR